MSECRHRHALGAFVLGGLDEVETDAVRRHLAECPTCRREHDEIAGAPALLGLVRDAPPPVPQRVRDGLVARAARRRTRRHWATASAAALVLVAVAAGLLGRAWAPDAPTRLVVPLEEVAPFEASGWAWLSDDAEGVRLHLDLEGLAPLEEPEVYEAWLYTSEERVVSVGQLPRGRSEARLEVAAEGDLADYTGVWVTAEPDGRDPAHEGPTVLRAAIPDPP